MEFLQSKKVPKAVGPYSHGIRYGNMILTSGQIPEDPKTGEMISDIKAATKLVLENLVSVVEEGGGTRETVAKVDVYLKDLNDFDLFNEAYIDFFGAHKPCRVLVQAGDLAEGAVLEAAMIAFVKE